MFTGMPRTTAALLVGLLLLLCTPAQSQNLVEQGPFWKKRGYTGGNIGFIGKGTIHLDSASHATDPGFTFGVKFDLRFHGNWFWGVSADIHRIHVLDTGQYFLDASLNLKHMIVSEYSMFGFRPGLGIGFGHLTGFRDYRSTRYFTCRVTFEFLFFSDGNSAPFVEVGLIAAPIGGNRDTKARFGPVLLGRVGILL